MSLRIAPRAALALVLFMVAAIVIFVYLMGRFGGPSVSFSAQPYHLTASFADAQGLANKSDVLIRGVKVGEVESIGVRGDRARVVFSVDRRYAPVGRNATAHVGQKTLLGEAYVDLDPGSRAAGTLPDGAQMAASRTPGSVELDEALKAFGEPQTTRHIRSLARTFGAGAQPPQTADRVSATLGRLPQLTAQLRRLTELLRGQESDIAAGVLDGRTALQAIGRHESQISELVSGARATLGALASRRAALGAALDELPRLLGAARRTLADARPLLVAARPLVDELRVASPPLTAALRALPPVTRDARVVLDRLPALYAAARPTLALALPVVRRAAPVARALEPALANLVPVLRYLEPRRNTLAAWFSNTAALGAHGDAKGKWARFNIFMEPGTDFGSPGSFSNNAYTGPNDATANQPYKPGSYPRLMPFRP